MPADQSSRDIHQLANLSTIATGYLQLGLKDIQTASEHLNRSLAAQKKMIEIVRRMTLAAKADPALISSVLGDLPAS